MSIWTVRDKIEAFLLETPELMRTPRTRVHLLAFDIANMLDTEKLIERPTTRWEHFKAGVLGD